MQLAPMRRPTLGASRAEKAHARLACGACNLPPAGLVRMQISLPVQGISKGVFHLAPAALTRYSTPCPRDPQGARPLGFPGQAENRAGSSARHANRGCSAQSHLEPGAKPLLPPCKATSVDAVLWERFVGGPAQQGVGVGREDHSAYCLRIYWRTSTARIRQ